MDFFDTAKLLTGPGWPVRSAIAWVGAGICLIIAIVGAMAGSGTGSATILSIPAGQFVAVLLVPALLAGIVFLAGAVHERLARNRDTSHGQ